MASHVLSVLSIVGIRRGYAEQRSHRSRFGGQTLKFADCCHRVDVQKGAQQLVATVRSSGQRMADVAARRAQRAKL